MRPLPSLALAALALTASPAAAQLSTRSISVESGVSTPLGSGAGASRAHALGASLWLEGEVDLTLRVVFGSAPRSGGRAADGWLAGTAGLRWSLAPGPLRPQLHAEAGWSRDGGGDSWALAAGAGLEWFPVRDLALRSDLRVTRGTGAAALGVGLGAALYF